LYERKGEREDRGQSEQGADLHRLGVSIARCGEWTGGEENGELFEEEFARR
jgi:hypothetical protein